MSDEYLLAPEEEYESTGTKTFSYSPLSRAYYLGRRDGFFRGLALGLAIGFVVILILKFS